MARSNLTLLYPVATILLGLTVIGANSPSTAVYDKTPEAVDPKAKYLFYMHGAWIEFKGLGLDQVHPRHGPYQYDKIVKTFSGRGLTVISEARLRRVGMREYAALVAGQVRNLLDRGVPQENVTVIGHSKGGHMALIAASLLEKQRVNFVIMAGCGRKGARFRRSYNKFLETHTGRLRGRILSLYDADDRSAGSCREAFAMAADTQTKEIVLETGRGHGLFYSPDAAWIREVVKWTEG